MSDINPYEAPAEWEPTETNSSIITHRLLEGRKQHVGVWRHGRVLIMHRHAKLPNRCVKTNQPTTDSERWLHTMTYCPGIVYLGLLVGLPLVLILYLILQKKAPINIGLSKSRLARRRRSLIIGWTLAGLSLLGFFTAMFAACDPIQEYFWAGPLAILSLVFLITAIVWGIRSQVVSAKFIDDKYIWLKGVHPDYLDMLPEWPGA